MMQIKQIRSSAAQIESKEMKGTENLKEQTIIKIKEENQTPILVKHNWEDRRSSFGYRNDFII